MPAGVAPDAGPGLRLSRPPISPHPPTNPRASLIFHGNGDDNLQRIQRLKNLEIMAWAPHPDPSIRWHLR
jgi:hypothetical protein